MGIFARNRIFHSTSLGLQSGDWPDTLTIENEVCTQGDHVTRGHHLDLLYVKYHAIEDPSKVFRVIAD